jgi:hypothetical protein
MAVRAAASLLAQITAKQSRYGCGASACLDCYPVQTVCGECDWEFRLPVLRTDTQTLYVCNSCWDFSMGYYATRVKGEN